MTEHNSGEPIAEPKMRRVTIDVPAAGEHMLLDGLAAMSASIYKETGVRVVLVSVGDPATREVKAKRVGGGQLRVVYKLTEKGKTAVMKGRKFQVRRIMEQYPEAEGVSAAQIVKDIEATGEPDALKAVQSALHGMRVDGDVESVEVE